MQLHWYAIYTKFNSEQILRECILNYSQRNALNYETYLPLTKEVKKWRDRVNVKKLPLFKNYLFVKHDDNGFYNIKTMKGFCDYVRFGSTPSTIPLEQMETIKKVVEHQKDECCQPSTLDKSKLVKGEKVKINNGALAGVEGVLLDGAKKNTLAIEIKGLKLYLNVQVAATDVTAMDEC
jgi:transcriptional antiterminator RfaH